MTKMLLKVRQVDLATVLASEAYVLFYRKASEGEQSGASTFISLFHETKGAKIVILQRTANNHDMNIRDSTRDWTEGRRAFVEGTTGCSPIQFGL